MIPQDVHDRGVGGTTSLTPPNVGSASSVLPEVQPTTMEENSQTGVSTRSVPVGKRWFVLRATYGREKKAAEYLKGKGIECFHPTITEKNVVKGKNKIIEGSRIPNIFFANSTMDEIKEHVYDNVHEETKHLRFYYNAHHDGTKEPLVVPESQMKSLMIICTSHVDGVLLTTNTIEKFRKGQHVIVREGEFAGVEGVVARFCGQLRVGITIEGMLTAATAYIPSAFLIKI